MSISPNDAASFDEGFAHLALSELWYHHRAYRLGQEIRAVMSDDADASRLASRDQATDLT